MAADGNGDGGGNGGPAVQEFLTEIGELDDELRTMQGEYRASCRGPRSKIKDVKTRAKDEGVNMTAFNVILAKYRADRAHERRVAGLENDDVVDLEEMRDGLVGLLDLPLGQAAMERAEREHQDNLAI